MTDEILKYEEIDPSSDLYRNNLVAWLNRFVETEVEGPIDFSKPRSHEIFEKKQHKFINDFDFHFLIGRFPSEHLVWTPTHKRAIEEFAARICVDLPIYAKYLFLLARVLEDFDSENYTGPEQQITKEVYSHMLEIFKVRFPDKYLIIEAILHKAITETETTRPECSECGSTEVNSYGLRWQCKSCGRTWLKNPRRQKHND